MKREPVVYGILVAAALLVAFRTWTQADRADAPVGTTLWHERADRIESIEYHRPGHDLLLVRRDANTDAPYFWATADTTAFQVGGEAGKRLLDALAAPVAVRDLGVPNAAERHEYGLDTARTRLVVRAGGRTRTLLVGGSVYSTDERYVVDPSSKRAYVVQQQAVQALENADQMLLERRLHAFQADQVGSVTLSSGKRTRTMRRVGDNPATGAIWTAPTGKAQADVTFANFMQRLEGMWVTGYAARENPAALTAVMRIDYRDKGGKPHGFFELWRTTAGSPPQYFLRTELTHTFVRPFAGAAEGAEADLGQMF